MSVQFRNVTAENDDPVESWPYEGLVAALERGGFREWRRIAAAIGTSASRLSTYCTGTVTPSAAVMLRMERAGFSLQGRTSDRGVL